MGDMGNRVDSYSRGSEKDTEVFFFSNDFLFLPIVWDAFTDFILQVNHSGNLCHI